MKSKPLIIIKLGGSVITYKDSNIPRPRKKDITRIAKELKKVYAKKYSIILVHGAGSYAHPIVKKSGIHNGMYSIFQRLAFNKTSLSLMQLNIFLLGELIKNSLPAVTLPPHSFVKNTRNGLRFKTDIIKDFLDQEMIPVLFGDMVLDDDKNCLVLSGDQIVTNLAKKFAAEDVIFISDVDGVFESDPKKNPEAGLIKEINNENLSQVLEGLTQNNIFDVTGEMRGKVLSLHKELKGKRIKLLNGLVPGRLVEAVSGDYIGTQLLFQ